MNSRIQCNSQINSLYVDFLFLVASGANCPKYDAHSGTLLIKDKVKVKIVDGDIIKREVIFTRIPKTVGYWDRVQDL